tara:strand:+ start:1884 stop:2051 length:168 start_codon:yes stop_codon:yes gene_type:complete
MDLQQRAFVEEAIKKNEAVDQAAFENATVSLEVDQEKAEREIFGKNKRIINKDLS